MNRLYEKAAKKITDFFINKSVIKDTDREIYEYGYELILEKVGLNKKAQALESGIDTILSTEFDGGIELSGGESQKIEIASAFYKQSKMLIFDEPTSRLDALAEKEIIESINKTFCDQTTILISHRLANVIACDKIYYMEAGQIIECGTHEELMIADGKYAKLFISQAQEYIPKGNGAVN